MHFIESSFKKEYSMSDFAIEARQLVKKFPARPGTGDKKAEGESPAPKKGIWPFRKKEPKTMFTAVNGVDLQIERGEIFGLLGQTAPANRPPSVCSVRCSSQPVARPKSTVLTSSSKPTTSGAAWELSWRASVAFIGS